MTTHDDTTDLTGFERRLLHDMLDAHREARHATAAPVPRSSRRRGSLRARQGLIALVASVVVIGGAVSTAAILNEPDPITFHAASPTTSPVTAVPTAIRNDFALFRDQPADHADAPSPPRSDSHAGINAALARTVETPVGAVTVVPGSDELCFQVAAPGGASGTCQPIAKANDGKLVMSRRGDGALRTDVVGVVPDAVSAVKLVEPGGSSTTSTVSHNVWSAERTHADHAQLLTKEGQVVGTVAIP